MEISHPYNYDIFDLDTLEVNIPDKELIKMFEDYATYQEKQLKIERDANNRLRYNLKNRERHLADVLSSIEGLANNLHLLVYSEPRAATTGDIPPIRATNSVPMRSG